MNRDVLVSSALLLLSLAFALHKLLKRPTKATTPKIDWEANAKQKKPITSRIQGISDETIRDWNELRMCDVTNVWVSNILVHPIKSCRGTSVQEAVFTPEGIEVSICLKISTCHSKIVDASSRKYDRKLVIIDARTNRCITAREVPKVSKALSNDRDLAQESFCR